MPGKIRNRFMDLLAAKAELEGRKISLTKAAKETGIALTTLFRWSHQDVDQYSGPVLIALCDYLECKIGDLIVYEPDGGYVVGSVTAGSE
jgi:DNA-binding Xre family transcriptional regulator